MKQTTNWLAIILLLTLLHCSSTLRAQTFNGLYFDGVNDYISLPSSNTLPIGNSDYTIEVWIKPAAMGTYGMIGWGPYWSNNQVNAFRLFSGGGNVGLDNYWWATDLLANTADLSGTWHHVAVTFNGVQRIIYLDGAVAGSDYPAATHSVPNANNATIGETYTGEFFNGAMDEMRIWNRALCQSEIQNNMNGELPNPTTQTGLVAYYKMDQGSASGTNTGVTTLIDASGNGNTGTLNNFALTGSTSNWVSGATAITGNVTQYTTSSTSALTESVTKSVTASANTFAGCGTINTITPAGTSPVSGTVVSRVTRDASVNTFVGKAYVQRHFDIEPATNATTATANLVLYFTQADFTAYNAARGSLPSLPVDAADVANYKSNLRIAQFHGVPVGGNAPGNYTATWTGVGPKEVLITPSSVTWNSGSSRWEVSFSITGFSGFFATTSTTPLPIGLTAFTATKSTDNDIVIAWSVAHPTDGKEYIVERSTDAKNFLPIGTLKATVATDYTLHDRQPLRGKSYYRLRALEIDGTETHSQVASVFIAPAGNINVYPSPAKDYFVIESSEVTATTATLSDLQGHNLMQVQVASGQKIDIAPLPAGLYILRVNGQTFKIVKE